MDILIEGLGTTLFSMGIVFLALIILSFCLDGLRLLVAVIERPVKQSPAAEKRDAIYTVDVKYGPKNVSKATEINNTIDTVKAIDAVETVETVDAINANDSIHAIASADANSIMSRVTPPADQMMQTEDQDEVQGIDPKIVAVLTAAVMAMEDGKRKYRLHAFQRIDQGPSPWVIAGRQDVMQGYWPK